MNTLNLDKWREDDDTVAVACWGKTGFGATPDDAMMELIEAHQKEIQEHRHVVEYLHGELETGVDIDE